MALCKMTMQSDQTKSPNKMTTVKMDKHNDSRQNDMQNDNVQNDQARK